MHTTALRFIFVRSKLLPNLPIDTPIALEDCFMRIRIFIINFGYYLIILSIFYFNWKHFFFGIFLQKEFKYFLLFCIKVWFSGHRMALSAQFLAKYNSQADILLNLVHCMSNLLFTWCHSWRNSAYTSLRFYCSIFYSIHI